MTSLPPDPWKALGIERNADKSEIRTAYRKLVLKCHPDKIQDPTLKALKADEFQKVQQAWELLNDDAEKAKYEQKLRLAELQRAAKVQQDVKNSPNMSVPRSSAKYYEVRTAEPASRYKSSPSSGKVYTYTATAHTRSYEEMPSSRSYPMYEEVDKQARRTASYEKPAKRDDERRDREKEERRRRKDEEAFKLQEKERERDREREREREKERKKDEERERKAEKKRLEREREKEREKDRKRDAEDKARRHKPYVEHYDSYVADIDLGIEEMIIEDTKYVTSSSKSEKKRSSSRKHEETRDRDRERDRERDRDRDRDREREKSNSRRAKSPHVDSERKHINLYESAASYLATKGTTTHTSTAFWKSQTPPETSYITPLAPTPPPVDDFEEESIRQSASRAAGRRASNDPARSREKLKYEPSDVTPKSRPVPPLSKSYSTPPPAPESPPRVSRSQTTPHESSYRPAHLSRGSTWAPESTSADVYYHPDEIESEDDRDRRRRSRRTRSPSGQSTRYKVDGVKTSKLEPQYSYGESPSSTRRYAGEEYLGRSPSSATYSGVPFSRVKQAKTFGPEDIAFAQYEPPYYTPHGAEAYTAKA